MPENKRIFTVNGDDTKVWTLEEWSKAGDAYMAANPKASVFEEFAYSPEDVKEGDQWFQGGKELSDPAHIVAKPSQEVPVAEGLSETKEKVNELTQQAKQYSKDIDSKIEYALDPIGAALKVGERIKERKPEEKVEQAEAQFVQLNPDMQGSDPVMTVRQYDYWGNKRKADNVRIKDLEQQLALDPNNAGLIGELETLKAAVESNPWTIAEKEWDAENTAEGYEAAKQLESDALKALNAKKNEVVLAKFNLPITMSMEEKAAAEREIDERFAPELDELGAAYEQAHEAAMNNNFGIYSRYYEEHKFDLQREENARLRKEANIDESAAARGADAKNINKISDSGNASLYMQLYSMAKGGDPVKDKENLLELERFNAADNYIVKAERLLKEYSTAGEALKGLALDQVEEWGSQSDMETYLEIFGIFSKLESALKQKDATLNDITEEDIENNLSLSEQALIRSFFLYCEAAAIAEKKQTSWYKGARIAGEMVPFMLEFLVTGGAGTAAEGAATKGLAKAFASWVRKSAKGSAARIAKRYASRAIVGTTKFAVKGATMTALRPSAYTGVAEAMTHIKEDGSLAGTKEFVNAVWDQGIETWSEMLGEKFLAFTKWGTKALGNTKWVKGLSESSFGQWGKAIGEKAVMQKIGRGLSISHKFLKPFGVQNSAVELLEEFAGAGMREVVYDQKALDHMFEGNNFESMLIGFSVMPMLGGTAGVAAVGYHNYKAAQLAENVRMSMMPMYDEKQVQHLFNRINGASSPAEMKKVIEPIVTQLRESNAGIEAVAAVTEYAGEVASYKTLLFVNQAEENGLAEEKRREAESDYGEFWIKGKGESSQNEESDAASEVSEEEAERKRKALDAARKVRIAKLNDGRMVFVLSEKPNEAGEYAVIDMASKKHGIIKESDIATREEDGKVVPIEKTWTMDQFLTTQVLKDTQDAEKARMEGDRQAQIDALKNRVQAEKKINIGTQEEPIVVPVQNISDTGVDYVDANGETLSLTWEQVGNALNQPIVVLTDKQIVEQETQRLIEMDKKRMAKHGPRQAVREGLSSKERWEAKKKTKNIPRNPDGTVDETSFWNNDPEGYAEWNDELNQDGGKDTKEQIAISLKELKKRHGELEKEANTSDPVKRKAAKLKMAEVAKRYAKVSALQLKYKLQPRIDAWDKAIGKGRIVRIYTPEDLARYGGKEAVVQMANPFQRVRGFAKGSMGYVYMPGLRSVEEYDEVMKHEVLSHLGLKELLGEEKFNEFLDVVWEMMPEEDKKRFSTYANVGKTANEQERQRVAADEYVAHLAETVDTAEFTTVEKTIWQRIVDFIKNLFRSKGVIVEGSEPVEIEDGKEVQVPAMLTDADIIEFIKKSYANLAAHKDTPIAAQVGFRKSAVEEAPSAARQEYDALLADLTPEEIAMVASNDLVAAQEAYNALAANAPRVEQGETSKAFVERKRAYAEQLEAAKAEMDAKQAIVDEAARMAEEQQPEVVAAPVEKAPRSLEPTIVETENGEAMAETDGNGSVRFSVLTYEQGGRDYLVNWLAGEKYMDQSEKDFIIATLDQQYNLAKQLGKDFPVFGAWSSAEVDVDAEGNPIMSVIKANGDYSMNLDFSLICKKRRPLNALLDVMIADRMLDMRTLNEGEIAKINKVIQRHGFEVACALCFVDSKRYRVVKVAADFADLYNDLVQSLIPAGSDIVATEYNYAGYEYINERNAEKTGRTLNSVPDAELDWTKVDEVLKGVKTPKTVEQKVAKMLRDNPEFRKLANATDFVTNLGFESVKRNNPELLKVYNAKKGTGGPKASFGDVQYLNDILKSKSFTPEKAYSVGGVRVQSFSDYMGHMFFDYMQMMAELAAKGLPAHAYTKEEAFARIFGMTGMKINMSLVPAVKADGVAPGLDAEGNYAWAVPYTDEQGNEIQGQTFPPEVAFEMQQDPRYSGNVGVIAVGVSDEHILKMLDDENIHFIIPYHKSSISGIVAKETNIDQFKDYTLTQNTKLAPTEENNSLSPKQKKKILEQNAFDFYKSLSRTNDPKATAQEYLDHCRNNGLVPKFEQFANHENYYKLLVDFNTYDFVTGEYAPQGPVKMNFPEELEALVKASVASNEVLESDLKDKVGKMAEDVKAELGETRFSARTDEQRTALFDAAKAEFGTTNNFNIAGYMLPDGSLLNFGDEANPRVRAEDHRAIEGVIMDEGKEYDSRWMYIADFMNEGAIRLLPEYAGINLMHAPTAEQRNRLFDFIYKYNGEVILEIADERLNNIAYVEYDRRTSPSRIFRDIDGYFNEGIVPQQDVRFSVGPRESSMEEMDELFAKYNTNETAAAIYDKVSALAKTLDLKIRFEKAWSRAAGETFADKVKFNMDFMESPFTFEEQKAHAILHELIHAVTSYAMQTKKVGWLTPEMSEAITQIEKIYEMVKADEDFNGMFAQRSASEMIAEMHDVAFRSKLKEKNLFQQIIDAIKKLLGFESSNALEDLDATFNYILDNFDYEAYSGFVRAAQKQDNYIRFSIGSNPQTDILNAKQTKKPGGMLSDKQLGVDEVRFSISKNNRATIDKWLGMRSDLSEAEKNAFMLYIDNREPVQQLAMARWFSKGAIRLPEDLTSIDNAFKFARKMNVDPMKYDTPAAVNKDYVDRFGEEKKEDGNRELLSPDDARFEGVLTNKVDYGNGIVVYDVQNDIEHGQRAVRDLMNDHLGADFNCWCLLYADSKGNPTKGSEGMWWTYNKTQKKVAFKDGKICAFCASTGRSSEWWDLHDQSHGKKIPVEAEVEGDKLGRRSICEFDGKNIRPVKKTPMYRGNKKNGLYEEWDNSDPNSITLRTTRKGGKDNGTKEMWDGKGNLTFVGRFKNGNAIGEHTGYASNGQEISKRSYDKDGLLDGEVLEYTPDGTLLKTGRFVHGKPVGKHLRYHENGRLMSEKDFQDGYKVGYETEYNEKGKVVSRKYHDMSVEEDGSTAIVTHDDNPSGPIEKYNKYDAEGNLLEHIAIEEVKSWFKTRRFIEISKEGVIIEYDSKLGITYYSDKAENVVLSNEYENPKKKVLYYKGGSFLFNRGKLNEDLVDEDSVGLIDEAKAKYNEIIEKQESQFNEIYNSLIASTNKPEVRFSVSITPEVRAEMDVIKATAMVNGNYMKAPNGQPTKLTEDQWALVRTKNFVRWFGDWLKPKRIEKLLNSKPIEVKGDEYVGNYELNKKSAFRYIDETLAGTYVNKDSGDSIRVSHKGAKKVTSHGYHDPIHLASVMYIPRMIEDAIFITEELNDKGKNEFESYRYYVCGLKIGGEDYTAKIVVGVRGGETYYDHQLSSIEKGKLINSRDRVTTQLAEDKSALYEVKDTRLLSILKENFSKVIDENGEPKVVYHGSGMAFTVFDKRKSDKNNELGTGFYFTDNPDIADLYTRSGFSDNEERYVRRAREIFNEKGAERGLTEEYESIEHFDFMEDHLEGYGFLDESVEADYEEAFEQAYEEMFSQKSVMPVFLNIRKPYMVEDVSPYNARELAKQQDVDGFIDRDFSKRHAFLRKHTDNKDFSQYVALNPNQIKSATETTGEFSESEDIRFSVHRPVGGNRGYVGYSMSKRAAAAREEGRYPKTDFKKEYGVTEKALDALVKAGIINNSEWHHTSVYGNKTTFYGWDEGYYADIYAENKSVIDKLAREGKNDEIETIFSKHPITLRAEKERERRTREAHAEHEREKAIREANAKFRASALREQMTKIKEAIAADERVTGNWFNASNGVSIRMDVEDIRYPEGISRAEKNTMREEARKELADLRAEVIANTPLEYDEAAYNAAIESAEQVYRQDMQRIAEEYADLAEEDTRFSVVTDPMLVAKLESEPKVKVYRAMQLIDGKLYPPMSAKIDGKMREPIELGKWEQAEERPDLVDEKGNFKLDKGNKTSLKARYNPYFHTSTTPLNDQFSSAQSRPELVTVEVEIPASELTSGYKAQGAKDAVGKLEWKAGVVQGKLSGTREVILSRWDKPIRIVPDSEVAAEIVKMFDGKNITMPSNVVTPSLRAELEKLGVPFVETNNNGKLVKRPESSDTRFSMLPVQQEIKAVRGLSLLDDMGLSFKDEINMIRDAIKAETGLLKKLDKVANKTPLVQQQIENAKQRLEISHRQLEILQEVEDHLIDTTPIEPDLATALEDMEPRSIKEFLADFFTMRKTPVKVTKVKDKDGNEVTVKQGGKKNGVMLDPETLEKELGWSRSDWKGLSYIVSAKEGLSIDKIAEMIAEDENAKEFFSNMDTMQIKDEVIDFLQSIGSYADIRDYIKKERARMAQEEADFVNGRLEEMAEGFEQQNGMSVEEYNEMLIQEAKEAREKWLVEAENPEAFNNFVNESNADYGTETSGQEGFVEEGMENAEGEQYDSGSSSVLENDEDLPEGDSRAVSRGDGSPEEGGDGRIDDSGTEAGDSEPAVVSEDVDTSRLTVEEVVNTGKQRALKENAEAADVFMKKMMLLNGAIGRVRSQLAAQREYDQETVKIITSLANSLLEDGRLSNMTRSEIKRLLSVIKDTVGKKDLSISVDRLMDIMISNQLRFGKNRFAEFMKIKGKKVDSRGVEVQGKLDHEGQRVMGAIKEGINLDAARLNDRIGEAEDKLFDESETVRRNAELDLAGYEMARQYLENIKESEAEEKDLRNELKNARDAQMTKQQYQEFVKSTYDAIRENRMLRVMAYENLLDNMAGVVAKSVTKAQQLREAEKQRIQQIQHYANSDMQGMPASAHKPKKGGFWNNPVVRFFLNPLATFDQMLRQFGKKSPNGEGYLWNHFMRGWLTATENEYTGFTSAMKALDEKVSSVFGKKMRWSDLYSVDRKMPKAGVSIWDDGKMVEYEVTQGNLLYIYMVNKMTDGKMKLRKMGITEEDVDKIVAQMDPRFLELADWLQGEFLPGLRDKYNAVHEAMFGAPMAAIDNYFPLKVLANARVREQDVNTPETDAKPSTITGSIIKRTKNSLALDVLGSNAFDVVVEHLQQMEHWAAFAEYNRDLNTLLSYKKFRNRVQNMSGIYGTGTTVWNNFRKAAEIAVGAYQPATQGDMLDKAITNIAKGVTGAKISFRVYTAIKQLLSMPAFISDANVVELTKSLAAPWVSWTWAINNLPLFDKRWRSRMAGDSRLMETDADWKMWKNRVVELAGKYGMTPNAFVDALTVAVGAKAIYETRKKQYLAKGYTEEAADKRAKQDATILFNESQQSNEGAFLAPAQVDRTAVSVAFTIFRNSSMGYQRMYVDALRNFKHMLTPGNKAQSIEFLKKQMMRDGVSEEDATMAAEKMYGKAWFKNAMRVVTFGFVVQFAWNLGSYLPYLLVGDDDEEKADMVKDAAMHGLLGGAIEGLSGGSVMSEMLNMVAKGETFEDYDPTLLPLVSDMKNLWKTMSSDEVAGVTDMFNLLMQSLVGVNPQTVTDIGAAIYDACNGDPETSREVALLIMRILQCPQSQIEKVYIDEIDFTVDEALDLTIEQLAKRYADYKVLRGAPLLGWAYGDEEKQEKIDKLVKRFTQKAEDLKRTRGNEKAKEFYQYYDNEYEDVTKTLGEYAREIELASYRDQDEKKAALKAEFGLFRTTEDFYEYKQLKKYIDKYEDKRKQMKDAIDPEVRRKKEKEMYEARDQMVAMRKELEYLSPYIQKVSMLESLMHNAKDNPEAWQAYADEWEKAIVAREEARQEYRAREESSEE